MADKQQTQNPDLRAGVACTDIPEAGMLAGHVGDQRVLVARINGEFFALSANCTHYGAPLEKGLVVGKTLRCPWHHACFSLQSGEPLAPPALDPLTCWHVQTEGDQVYVRERRQPPQTRQPRPARPAAAVVIVGGGAAGEAAAQTLRQEGYDGPVTMVSSDSVPPCDRPNLSKDYLAGKAKVSWIPLRGEDFYREQQIDLRLNNEVAEIEPAHSHLHLANGSTLVYGALLLATGAEPVRLETPGADGPHVHYLRSQADSEAIIQAVEAGAKRAVIIGASFIGLEVAASLCQRGLEVHIVAPDAHPLAHVMGAVLGDFIRSLYESKGVTFHLGRTASIIEADQVTLDDGHKLASDMVVAGIGVRPRTALAQAAGLKVDEGVVVNQHLQASVSNIYAAGDIASWPDPFTGHRLRVEHWTVAQRQGQVAARNMLGAEVPYSAVPFFWSQHFDASINYVGHASRWDRIETDGDPADYDFAARFIAGGRTLAVATIFRDIESLRAEADMEAAARAVGANQMQR